MPTYALRVNGKAARIDADADMPLLYALRDRLGLNGPKYGCGLGQCGTCTVHISGQVARSCSIPIASVAGKDVTTLEGLARGERLHPVQQAFIDEQAVQCGYCLNGMVMAGAALIATNKRPTEAEIKVALAGNLCRCGTHQRIVRAIARAATLA